MDTVEKNCNDLEKGNLENEVVTKLKISPAKARILSKEKLCKKLNIPIVDDQDFALPLHPDLKKSCGPLKLKDEDRVMDQSEIQEAFVQKYGKGRWNEISPEYTRKQLCTMIYGPTVDDKEPWKTKVPEIVETLREKDRKKDVCSDSPIKGLNSRVTRAWIENLYYEKGFEKNRNKIKTLELKTLCEELNIPYQENANRGVFTHRRNETFRLYPGIASFQSLSEHQQRVGNYMKNNRGIIAFHKMGSGKTLTSISCAVQFLTDNPTKDVVIICPKGVRDDFMNAIATLTKDTNLTLDRFHIYTKEKFRRLYLKDSLISVDDWMVIIDEAHNMRNEVVVRSEGKIEKGVTNNIIMTACKTAAKVILLTGTIVVNTPEDIYNLWLLVKGYDAQDAKTIFKNAPDALYREQFLNNLTSVYDPLQDPTEKNLYPSKTMENVYLPMTKKEEEEYNKLEKETFKKDGITDPENFLLKENFGVWATSKNLRAFYHSLRKALNSYGEQLSTKINYIMELLQQNPDKKFLIYSEFLRYGIGRVEKALKKKGITNYVNFTGKVSETERRISIQNYNDGTARIMLLSRAGGEGLDLKNTWGVIIMETQFNESITNQVIGRAVRKNSHAELPEDQRTVHVYRLFSVRETEREAAEWIAKYIAENSDLSKMLDTFKNKFFRSNNILPTMDIFTYLRSVQKESILEGYRQEILKYSIEATKAE